MAADPHKWQSDTDLADAINENPGSVRAWARHNEMGHDTEYDVEKVEKRGVKLYRLSPEDEVRDKTDDDWKVVNRKGTVSVVHDGDVERTTIATFWPGLVDMPREEVVEIAADLKRVLSEREGVQ